MTQKGLVKEVFKQEQLLLMENESAVNRHAAFILLLIGAVFVPLVFLLRYLGFFLFPIEEGLVPLMTTAAVLLIPSVLGVINGYTKPWYKYIIVASVTFCIPSLYIEFDYMMLMLWIMPGLMSCLYFDKRLNKISLLLTLLVLGLTSYYRSYHRLIEGLIGAEIGGLFKDFIVSYTTYALLTSVLFIFIRAITKKANELLNEMITSKKYEKMSVTDGLTGVFNYRHIMDVLEKNRLEYERNGTPFTIIVFDVDHFKRINDTYGHLVGDKALVLISTSLEDNIRENDIVGRYGGEEFIVVFPDTDLHAAYAIAERCREVISAIVVENTSIQLTVSGGIQEYKGGLISDMINNADMKMFYAKGAGRNKVETHFTQVFES